jgi:hypothetical protein
MHMERRGRLFGGVNVVGNKIELRRLQVNGDERGRVARVQGVWV